jgi:hypothetical protein
MLGAVELLEIMKQRLRIAFQGASVEEVAEISGAFDRASAAIGDLSPRIAAIACAALLTDRYEKAVESMTL